MSEIRYGHKPPKLNHSPQTIFFPPLYNDSSMSLNNFTNQFQDPQKMDLITSFPISNPNLWGGWKTQKFIEICCSYFDLYLSNKNRFWKNERGYCYLVCYEKKPLSFLWDLFSFSRQLYFKHMCHTRKFWDLKIRAQEMDSILRICDTCRKTERFYCSLVCYEKKPLSVIWDSF